MQVPDDAGSLATGIIVGPNWTVPRLESIPHAVVRQVGLAKHGPAWQWKRAVNMNDSRRARRTTDYGSEVWQAIHFQAESDDVVPERFLAGREVAVAEAYAIYSDRGRRLQTESRILTGVGIEQIAYVAGIEPRIIQDYCLLFFDVLDKLEAKSWIGINVIKSPHEPVCHLQRLLYWSAYTGGWHVCEHWLSHYHRLGATHDLSTSDGRDLEQLELLLQLEAIASKTPERVIETAIKFGSLPSAKRPIERSVADLLTSQVNKHLQAALSHVESNPNAAASPQRRPAALRSA